MSSVEPVRRDNPLRVPRNTTATAAAKNSSDPAPAAGTSTALTAATAKPTGNVLPAKRNLPSFEYEFEFVVNVQNEQTEDDHRGAQRSRASCDYCRQRHWRCDNKRPACTNCVSMNQSCTYLNPRKKRGRIPKKNIEQNNNNNVQNANPVTSPASGTSSPPSTPPNSMPSTSTMLPTITITDVPVSSSAATSAIPLNNSLGSNGAPWDSSQFFESTSAFHPPNTPASSLSTSGLSNSAFQLAALRRNSQAFPSAFEVPSSPLWFLPLEPASPATQSLESVLGLNLSGEKNPFKLGTSGDRNPFRFLGTSGEKAPPFRFSGLGFSGEQFHVRRLNNSNSSATTSAAQTSANEPVLIVESPAYAPRDEAAEVSLSHSQQQHSPSPSPTGTPAISVTDPAVLNLYMTNYYKYMGILFAVMDTAPIDVLSRNLTTLPADYTPSKIDADEITLCVCLGFGARILTGSTGSVEFSTRAMYLLDICWQHIMSSPYCRDSMPSEERQAFLISLGGALFMCAHYWLTNNLFDALKEYQPMVVRMWEDLSYLYSINKNVKIATVLIRYASHIQILPASHVGSDLAEQTYNYAQDLPATIPDQIFFYLFRLMANVSGLHPKRIIESEDPLYHLKEALWCSDKLQEGLEEWEASNPLRDETTSWFPYNFAFVISAGKAVIYHKMGMYRMSTKWSSNAHLQMKNPNFNTYFTGVCASCSFLFTAHLERKEYDKVQDILSTFGHAADRYPMLKTQFSLVKEILSKISARNSKAAKTSIPILAIDHDREDREETDPQPTSTQPPPPPQQLPPQSQPPTPKAKTTVLTEEEGKKYPSRLRHLIQVTVPVD